MNSPQFLFILLFCCLLVLPAGVIKGQGKKGTMNLLATAPYSMRTTGVYRNNFPVCRKLKKKYEAEYEQWQQLLQENQSSNNPEVRKKISTLGQAYYRNKQSYRKTCKTRTTRAVEEGFRDSIHKLQIELKARNIQTVVYKYPTHEELEGRPDTRLENLREGTTLSDLLDGAEAVQSSILELYQSEGIGAASGDENPITSGEFEVIANRKMRRMFTDLYDTVLSDGDGQFVPNPLEDPDEIETLDLVFSHYYQIQKHSVSRYTLNIHLFLMDATQRDPQTKLYPVYNKQTQPTSWRRSTDYVGNLSKELSFVAEKFAFGQ